jgi:hypothetical protein
MNIDFTRRYATKDSLYKFNGLNCGLCNGPLVTLLFENQSINQISCEKCDLHMYCYNDMYGCIAIDSITIQKFNFAPTKTSVHVCALGTFDAHYTVFQDSSILSLIEVQRAIESGRLHKLCGIAVPIKPITI